MRENVIIAGAGGQGIMLLGKVLSTAAMIENKFVTWLPAYGPEVRGGAAHCVTVISDTEIGSPQIKKADTLIIMNALSFEKFKERLTPKGLLILNSSLITAAGKTGKQKVLQFPFTEIAENLGNSKIANMVALGCYLASKKIIKIESVLKAMIELAPKGRSDLIEINKQALLKGVGLQAQDSLTGRLND